MDRVTKCTLTVTLTRGEWKGGHTDTWKYRQANHIISPKTFILQGSYYSYYRFTNILGKKKRLPVLPLIYVSKKFLQVISL